MHSIGIKLGEWWKHKGSRLTLSTILINFLYLSFRNYPPMAGRRSSGQAPGLRRESTSMGQPRGERFTIQTSKNSNILVATSASSTQITVDTNASCVFYLWIYQENIEVWQAQPYRHIFHSDYVNKVSFLIIEDLGYANKRSSGTKGLKNYVLYIMVILLSGYLQQQTLRTMLVSLSPNHPTDFLCANCTVHTFTYRDLPTLFSKDSSRRRLIVGPGLLVGVGWDRG
jgi:hypothetical protein